MCWEYLMLAQRSFITLIEAVITDHAVTREQLFTATGIRSMWTVASALVS